MSEHAARLWSYAMPRVRFTLRWLMVAVAISAILAAFGARAWRERAARNRYLAAAEMHKRSLMKYWHAGVSQANEVRGEFEPRIERLTREIDALAKLPSALTAAEDDEIRRKKAAARRRLATAKEGENAGHRRAHAILNKSTYHFYLMGKYERAARSPWLPVEPDPPEPE